MADNQAPAAHQPEFQPITPPNPLSSIISKFAEIVNFRFPPPPVKEDTKKVETESKSAGNAVVRSGEPVVDSSEPVTVRLPDARTPTVAPLKLEAEVIEQDTKPVVLWQVYAIGGFFILRWVVARWKERRANKKSPGEDSPPPPPPAATADRND